MSWEEQGDELDSMDTQSKRPRSIAWPLAGIALLVTVVGILFLPTGPCPQCGSEYRETAHSLEDQTIKSFWAVE